MNQVTTTERTLFQTVLRILLGAFLAFAGTGHLTWHRTEFLAQVPTWLPINADLVVLLSGVVEISLGLSLLFLRSKQVQVGWIVALFFVLIFPGNISQYMNGISAFGLDTDRARLIRLFFQPVLVLWALWSCGSWQNFRAKSKT
ncbi:hypothetical protein JWG40_17185 [Leptospira sp. 201903074]|uniref:DoxX family protein n=1 Tax=Leptospira abararensis TaxID=2810036 RepID=UPI0019635D77|nr:hypothetical protein [Leptospira abararensis]MBM9548762.1 hypothetical protein [Leptospira abararensis]